MESTDKFKYYVLQLVKSPYKDDYLIVPWSWIVGRRKTDKKVVVSYPDENPSDTAERVKRSQKRSEDWETYSADVKFVAGDYEAAENFIKSSVEKYKCTNMEKEITELPAPVEKKIRRTKQNSNSNHEMDKPLDLVVTSENNDQSERKRLKRMALPTPDIEAALERSKVVEPTEFLSQTFECLSENQPSPTREDFPMQNSCSSEKSVEESNDRSCVEESNDRSCVEEIEHAENITQKQPPVIQNFSNSKNSSSNPKQIIVDPNTFTGLFEVLRNLHKVSANSYLLIDNLRKVIIDNTEVLNNVKPLMADSCSSKSDTPTASPSTETTAEVEMISEETQSKQQHKEYDDHGDDDTVEVSKKRRFQKRKFVLPPEYDENDSRWTLKHRKLAPGLVELVPHTNVYINSLALSNCKRLSKDCKTLARLLLVEIFTKSALTICSLTGSRATVRPGLDENARTVLLTYVEEYGRAKEWITVDTSSIQSSLRNKMQDFRLKYG